MIELGNENNTVEEAKNAMTPLADVLHQVLSGKANNGSHFLTEKTVFSLIYGYKRKWQPLFAILFAGNRVTVLYFMRKRKYRKHMLQSFPVEWR